MDHIEQLLGENNVLCNADAGSRKRVLQVIAELMADDEVSEDELFEGLMGRERLGSTGLGDGVAIPHCRMECPHMRVALVSLPEPIDYEASDGEPVDLLFVLVVPTEEQEAHLQALAVLAEVFSDPDNRAALRACNSNDQLRDAMIERIAQQVPSSKTA